MLADLREGSHIIDTSIIRPAQLLAYVKDLISAPASSMTLVFESFAFKRGIPLDADYVFDVRMLPNPHYETGLRNLTGCDAPVASFLQNLPEVADMQADISNFVGKWLAALVRDHRSYVTIAIGCTGGQHRSVYLVEQLAASFASDTENYRVSNLRTGAGKPNLGQTSAATQFPLIFSAVSFWFSFICKRTG
jgi:UPF0042 nucleotide-binding protein